MKKYILLIFPVLFFACTNTSTPDSLIEKQAVIFPDYNGVTFPYNIAPPNFAIEEEGDGFMVEIGQKDNESVIKYKSSKPEIYIPQSAWKKLLTQAKGNDIYFRIYVHNNNKWAQYADISNTISEEPIDEYLVYRLLYPGYELWNQMGIYQRNLTSYKQEAVVENKSLETGCVNCHTFSKNSPETMLLHIRGAVGGTVIVRNGKTIKTDMKVKDMNSRGTYPSWHPSGNFIAFSMNDIRQYFHITGDKPIEVSDLESDLAFYDCETDEIFTDDRISGKEYMETYPAWAPDGKTLYFCRANATTDSTPLDEIRYDLYKLTFDAEKKQITDPVCVYNASDSLKSVSFPRVSPDGKHLMFTLSDYGNFSIWHPESELYVWDINNDKIRCLDEVNSNHVDSYHNWSSTGKWFVFSSKRIDGLWARPHFASFDPNTGKASKAFVMPQKDPYFYNKFTKTYNLPELITAPIKNKRDFK